jgi:hypothetical protein
MTKTHDEFGSDGIQVKPPKSVRANWAQRFVPRILTGLLATLMFSTSALAQEIPKGVTYKPAPDAVNAVAKSALETALRADSFPKEIFGEVMVCGPMLWKALKPSAPSELLNAKPVIALIQVPESIQADAKRIITVNEQQLFWRLMRTKYASFSAANVRKAHADEISFYWATIPFDIEEPFFVVEAGVERFVVQLMNKNGKVTLFWIDLVGDLRTLKQK